MQSFTINPNTDEWSLPIITPRLLIRQPQLEDAFILNFAKNESLPELSRYMDWAQSIESIEETISYIKQSMANWILKECRYPFLPLLLFDVERNLVGSVCYHYYDWNVPCLDIGYWSNTRFSKNGYITEAVNALTRYAFEYLGCRRITIACDSSNGPSRKIPERLGYQLEATFKSNIVTPGTGQVSDTIFYSCFDCSQLPELNVFW